MCSPVSRLPVNRSPDSPAPIPDNPLRPRESGTSRHEAHAPATHLPVLLEEAGRAAARLGRRFGLSSPAVEDLCQELLLDLIRRLPGFDPGRGGIGAFAGVVLRNRAARIAARMRRERRAAHGPLLSLDASAEDDVGFGAGLAEADGLAAWLGQPVVDEAAIVAQLDLARAVAFLTPQEQAFFAAAEHSPQPLAEQNFGSRPTIYRKLHDLRCVLVACGVAA